MERSEDLMAQRAVKFTRAFLVGCVVGIAVMVAVNVPVYHFGNWPDHPRDYFGFWGVFFGSFAAALSFGLALAFIRTGPDAEDVTRPPLKGRRVGLLIAAIVAGLFG